LSYTLHFKIVALNLQFIKHKTHDKYNKRIIGALVKPWYIMFPILIWLIFQKAIKKREFPKVGTLFFLLKKQMLSNVSPINI